MVWAVLVLAIGAAGLPAMVNTPVVASSQRVAPSCGVAGRVTDASGRPVANARIEPVDRAIEPAYSDANGNYCLPSFEDKRRLQLIITADGHQEELSPEIDVGPGIRTRVDVTLSRRFVEEVTVTGRADSLVGISASASEGSVGAAELESRPLLRSSDIMEVVPGIAMTQHSTGGHAPIILLRGYNLDHGTDFATFLEGVPLNLPSHAHAQGYTDLNFLITEMVSRIDFQKGPYAAGVGDFATAGAANIELADTIAAPFAAFETGPHDFYHGVAGGSIARGTTRWLYGAEATHNDGPNVVPDDFRRAKGLLRYSQGDAQHGYSVSLFSFGASWNASDGYPVRALANGYITRFGTLDPSDGGRSQRHIGIANWRNSRERSLTRITAYAQYYDFDLFSNLTFWTRHPESGDQIHQSERRFSSGLLVSHKRFASWRNRPLELTIGTQVRNDLVGISLFNTVRRAPVDKRDDAGHVSAARVFDNDINESSVAPYVDARVHWTSWLRTVLGLRGDLLHLHVTSDREANSGRATAGLASPKVGVVLGPWKQTEAYVNGGYGFHSNHANGVVQHIDPIVGQPVTPADPMVRTFGAELGVRTFAVSNLQSSVSLWMINSDSELVYSPESGVTEPERPGRRFGVEWNNFYRVRPWMAIDLDAAWSNARYRTDPDAEGRYIPDAVNGVLSTGVSLAGRRLSGSLRGRYIGPRPLVPDGSVSSSTSLVFNGEAHLRIGDRYDVGVELFNIFNREYEDIAYYFETRIQNPRSIGVLEPAAQPDFVTHPGEPRTARVKFRARF